MLVATLGDKSEDRFSDVPTTRQPWDSSSCRNSELRREGLSFSLNSPTSAAHLTFGVCRWLGCDTRHLEQGWQWCTVLILNSKWLLYVIQKWGITLSKFISSFKIWVAWENDDLSSESENRSDTSSLGSLPPWGESGCLSSWGESGEDETPGGTPWGPREATCALLPHLPEHSQTWGSSQTLFCFPFPQLAKSGGYGVRLPGWEFFLCSLHAVGPHISALSSVKWDDKSIYLLRLLWGWWNDLIYAKHLVIHTPGTF